jgi:hypothetical protein
MNYEILFYAIIGWIIGGVVAEIIWQKFVGILKIDCRTKTIFLKWRNTKMSESKPREFWIAETLIGNLHIFRENHEGGGLTKFVENCYVFQLEQKVAENESLLSAKNAEIRKLEKQLEVCKAGLDYYANHESVIGEVTQDDKKNVQVVHTFINHKAKECLKELEKVEG